MSRTVDDYMKLLSNNHAIHTADSTKTNRLRPTAVDVVPQKDYRLLLTFDNGEKRILDVTPYIKGDWYGKLKDESYFATAKADGYTIAWPNGQDLCPDEVYYNSLSVDKDE